MALEAQERLPGFKKPVIDRSMGAVAVGAILRHICMAIKKGPSLLRMALDTGFLDRILHKVVVSKSAVGIMTVDTEYPALLKRMMTRQGKLGLNRLVAAETKLT